MLETRIAVYVHEFQTSVSLSKHELKGEVTEGKGV